LSFASSRASRTRRSQRSRPATLAR
jgi:hypothetical protein